MRDHRGEIEAIGGRCIAVGFSPAGGLAGLARHLDWPWPFLADEGRVLYSRLGAGRARLHRVYSPGTVLRYLSAATHGVRLHRPVEDTRQLGADAVIRLGRVAWIYRQRSPDDRPSAALLLDHLRAAAGD